MVVPDEVILTLGVESWAVKLVKAKADNDLIVQNVIGVTKEFNIPAKYVQTDYLNVQPSFENYEHHVITGYYVRRNVVITLKDLTQFEDLLSAALESGVNYVHGIDFRTTELRKHRDQARDLALQAASEKAQAMATKLDQTIGEPLAVVESEHLLVLAIYLVLELGRQRWDVPKCGPERLRRLRRRLEPERRGHGARSDRGRRNSDCRIRIEINPWLQPRRCQRSGLVFSRTMTFFASRSSCTDLAHQPALAPPGNRSAGK